MTNPYHWNSSLLSSQFSFSRSIFLNFDLRILFLFSERSRILSSRHWRLYSFYSAYVVLISSKRLYTTSILDWLRVFTTKYAPIRCDTDLWGRLGRWSTLELWEKTRKEHNLYYLGFHPICWRFLPFTLLIFLVCLTTTWFLHNRLLLIHIKIIQNTTYKLNIQAPFLVGGLRGQITEVFIIFLMTSAPRACANCLARYFYTDIYQERTSFASEKEVEVGSIRQKTESNTHQLHKVKGQCIHHPNTGPRENGYSLSKPKYALIDRAIIQIEYNLFGWSPALHSKTQSCCSVASSISSHHLSPTSSLPHMFFVTQKSMDAITIITSGIVHLD